jgi:ABC-2 type transport system ATP-binding protein
MFLSLKNVRKEFDGKVAVDDLCLEIPRGIIYGLIGPNGAGKTTTIRMIMDITAPDSGSIMFEGQPRRPDFKNHVGYLPEERGLYKKMTLHEIIIYLSELKGMSPAKTRPQIDPWLERVGLADYGQKKVEELSKGMQQKLQFVTTIIHDPDLIVLDELFSGLDPLNMELIKDIILDLKRAGKTVLFSTHVMEQAEKLCDNICMISNGKKVLDGRLADVRAQFGKNSVQLEIDGDGHFIRSLPGVGDVSEFSNYLELQLLDNADSNALLIAIAQKVTVRRFDIVEPSLYDIFIDMAKIDPSELDKPGGERHV